MPDVRVIRAEVKQEIDFMSYEDVRGLQEYLATYPDPDTASLRRVPIDDEPLSDEELRSIEEFQLFKKNGGKCIPDEVVARELGLD